MRRYKRYAAYRDSGVEWLGAVPAHWDIERLKRIASIWFSNVDKHSNAGEVSVRLCNYTDVYYNDEIAESIEFMSATATPDEIRRFAVKRGDVLITKDSESWDDIAVPAYVSTDLDGLLCGYHLAQIRPHATRVEGAYLARAFAALGIREQFHVAATGITRFGLSASSVSDALFPVPPLEEQRNIVAFLNSQTSKIDTLIAKKQRLIKLLQEKRAASITAAVTGQANPSARMQRTSVSYFGELPANWRAGALSRWCSVVDCKHRTVSFQTDGIPVASIGQVQDLRLNLDGAKKTSLREYAHMIEGGRRPLSGDIIYSRNATVGAASLVSGDSPFCMGQDVSLIRCFSDDPEYLLFLLRSPAIMMQLDLAMVGTTFKRINVGQIKQLQICLPPVDEQRRISHFCWQEHEKYESLVNVVAEGAKRLGQLRTALISAAVTGKIDVREEVA